MLVALTKRGGKLNVEKYRVKWLEIERSLAFAKLEFVYSRRA